MDVCFFGKTPTHRIKINQSQSKQYSVLNSRATCFLFYTDFFNRTTCYHQSAGGQTLQRWALLSNSPAWNTSSVGIRVVVANPRSYAYLDDRRWLAPNPEEQGQNNNDDTEIFRRPTANNGIDTYCPWYNHWLWGLEDGGELPCPYRDSAVAQVGSAAAIAKRYASRNVVSPTNALLQMHDRHFLLYMYLCLCLVVLVLRFDWKANIYMYIHFNRTTTDISILLWFLGSYTKLFNNHWTTDLSIGGVRHSSPA